MRLVALSTMRASLQMLVVLAALGSLGLVAAGCESSATAATVETTLAQSSTAQSEVSATPETTTAVPDTTATTSSSTTSRNTSGSDLFDTSIVHEITVSFAQEDYDAMVQAFEDTGDKEWISATVTIDGEAYENVGMRLKGNSSIMGLRRGGNGGMNGAGGVNEGMNGAGGGNGGRAGGAGPMGGSASFEEPGSLPWLIDLDKNVDNQNHDGVVELVVRSNNSQTALNEAVSLDLLQEAGLASQEAVYASFSVNGGEATLRLVIENPDDMWMANNFSNTGALYKAESTGDYSYRGDDPDSYDEVFDQEAGKTNADLTPLIEFLDFINNADDATFNAELPDRLDIDAFATYLAMQDLIGNTDDIDGPGNNSYLYYDAKTERFTVVAWDHNLAFGGMGGGGHGGMVFDGTIPDDAQMPGRMELPKGTEMPDGTQWPGGAETPQDMQRPDSGQRPDGAFVPGDAQGQTGEQGRFRGAGGFGGGRSNILVQRFNANAEWQQLYEDRLVELRSALYESGKAANILANWVALLKTQASDLVDAATVDQEADRISAHFTDE